MLSLMMIPAAQSRPNEITRAANDSALPWLEGCSLSGGFKDVFNPINNIPEVNTSAVDSMASAINA